MATEIPTRQEALGQLADSRAALLGIVDRADVQGWVNERTGRRVIDVLAHVAQWELHAAVAIETYALRGEFRLAPPFDIEAVNQTIFEQHRDRPATEVLAFLSTARTRLISAAESIPADRWAGPMCYPWGAEGTVGALLLDMRGHEQAHARQIEAIA
jgi:hypothetical protein